MPTLRRLSAVALIALLAAGAAWAVDVSPPTSVRLTVTTGPKPEAVTGELVAYDDDSLTLVVDGQRQDFAYADLTPNSAFIARYRVVDEKDARSWLELGRFGRAVGAGRQSEQALLKAVSLDASLSAEAEAIRSDPAGTLRPPPPEMPDDPPATQPAEAVEGPAGMGLPAPRNVPPVGPRATGNSVNKYPPVDAGQARLAVEEARREALGVIQRFGVSLRTFETPHFVVFTDWAPVDDRFLADSLEFAYTLLCREFDVPYQENVFVGKLPVYMFHSHDDFLAYARLVDGNEDFRETVAGYYRGRSDGMGKLVMSKPSRTDDVGLEVARKMWSRTLTHEFAHAFIARYRSNAFIPRWLNEGLAEVVAEQIYPRPRAMETALQRAREGPSIAPLFDDAQMPPADLYPVAMTLVQALHREDPRRFGLLIDHIKNGEDAEQALMAIYGVNYAGLEQAWREMMLRR